MNTLQQSHEYIIYALIVLMGISIIGVMRLIYLYKTEKTESGKTKIKQTRFRRRAIQFLAVGISIPGIIILGILGILKTEAIATLFGTFFGYVLSGIGDEEKDA